MALCPEVKPLQIIPVHLVKTLKPNSPTHLAMSYVELVESLLGAMGTESSGFTVTNVMKVRGEVTAQGGFSDGFLGACLAFFECLRIPEEVYSFDQQCW